MIELKGAKMTQANNDFIDEAGWHGKICIGGWVVGGGGTIEVTAPANGAPVATVGRADAADVAQAAAAAARAQTAWQATPALKRSQILHRAADLLLEHAVVMMPWIMRETGSVATKAMVEIEGSADFIRAAAAAALESRGSIIPQPTAATKNFCACRMAL